MPIRPQSSIPSSPFKTYGASHGGSSLAEPVSTSVAAERLRGEIAGGALGGAEARRLVALVALLADLEAAG